MARHASSQARVAVADGWRWEVTRNEGGGYISIHLAPSLFLLVKRSHKRMYSGTILGTLGCQGHSV